MEHEKEAMENWQVEQIAEDYYAIFHREESREWVDERGDNLCFETDTEALKYLSEKTGHDLPV